MDNPSFKNSTLNVFDKEETRNTNKLSGITNNGTTVELDEVDLRNGIKELHQTEAQQTISFPLRSIN